MKISELPGGLPARSTLPLSRELGVIVGKGAPTAIATTR